jgi:hypothetical protein
MLLKGNSIWVCNMSLNEAWDNLMNIASMKDLEAVSEIVDDDVLLSVDGQVWKGIESYLAAAKGLWHDHLPDGRFISDNQRIEVSKDKSLGYVFGTHSFIKDDDTVVEHVHHLYV